MAFDMSIPSGRFVETEYEARQWVQYFLQTHRINNGLGIDSETTDRDKITSRILLWSLSDGRERVCMEPKFLQLFKEPILENPDVNFDFSNAKFDAHMYANMGIDLTKAGDWRDTVVQSWLLNENNIGRHGLKECITDHFGRVTPTFEQIFGKTEKRTHPKTKLITKLVTPADLIRTALADPVRRAASADYASLDAYNTTTLRRHFDGLLDEIDIGYMSLKNYYYSTEVPYTKVLFKCERRGITVDKSHLMLQQGPMKEAMDNIGREFAREAGRTLNLESNQKDVPWFFFEHLKKAAIKMTKGGASGIKKPSADADVLEEWAGQGDPWALRMLEYRGISKIYGTYVVGLQKWLDDNFRIHTKLNQTGAVTGRLSSSEPNLQNIPRPDGDRFHIREAFTHGPYQKLVVADYEQLEMRLMAHFSGDEKMVNAIRSGTDIHCLTVSEVNGIPYDDVIAAKKAEKAVKGGKRTEPLTEREMELLFKRQGAKATGFGIMYGLGGKHLAANLTKEFKQLVTEHEGHQLIQKWFSVFPGVHNYIDDTRDRLEVDGYVQVLTGRFRRLGDVRNMNRKDAAQAKRQGVNSIIQGTAAEIAKKVMIIAEDDSELKQLGASMLLQIHDEIIWECPDDREIVTRVKGRVKEIMEHPFSEALLVPTPVEVSHGSTWAEAK